jgi:hypothetical protein
VLRLEIGQDEAAIRTFMSVHCARDSATVSLRSLTVFQNIARLMLAKE